MKYEFRWNDWNLEHVSEHGILPEEAESVVCDARPPFPRELENEKLLVRGRTADGHYLQAIYIVDPEGTIYVIHARPLTEAEKRAFRRNLK